MVGLLEVRVVYTLCIRLCWKFVWPLFLSMFHLSKKFLSFIFFGLLINDVVCYGGQRLLLVFAYELFLGFFM